MSEHPRTLKLRLSKTLGSLLLGEYWKASWQAHVQGLEPPPLPANLEEAMKVSVGVRVIEFPLPDSDSYPPSM